MGIGSFFASLFQKEGDDRKEIRKLDLAPEKTGSTSEDTERISISEKKETLSKEKTLVTEKEAGDTNTGRVRDRGDDGTGRFKEKVKDQKGPEVQEKMKGSRKDRPGRKNAAPVKKNAQSKEYGKADSGLQEEQGQVKEAMTDPGRQEADGFKKAKKDLYQYLNQTLRILYQADQEESWETMGTLDSPSDSVKESLDRIKEELPENLWNMAAPFVDEKKLAAPADLKLDFYGMLLPFYPLYHSSFEDFKFNTFLNREALDLFRRLTGRKFRLGYRNRYPEGHNAFEWKGETYRVYDRKGYLLCDAVFCDGHVKDGYAVLPEESSQEGDWSVRRKGTFVDEQFMDGAVEYIFLKPIG